MAISAPLALFFLWAPLSQGPQGRLPKPSTTATSYLMQIPVTEVRSSDEDSAILREAFASHASELLWSEVLPIAYEGTDTVENVRLAAEAVDLTAVHPRETFSFNDIVGIRTEDKGYRPGLMYSNGELVTGIGGGICITSTQLYKAALESGLKIIERHPHSGPVSYADPGRDAAVSFGWADMRFKNDTDSVLLIRSIVRDDKLIVALYGEKKPGRTVEIVSEDYEEIPYRTIEREVVAVADGEPAVEQMPRSGYAVTTVRLIKQDGKLVKREVISRDVVMPRNRIVPVDSTENIPTERESLEIRVPFQSPKRKSLPLPACPDPLGRVEGTISIPDEPQPPAGGLTLPDRTFSTSERTDSAAPE